MPITSCEYIEGQKLHNIIDELAIKKTFVKIYLEQINYESLTLITGVDTTLQDNIFSFDPPKGLLAAIGEAKAKFIYFEFTSKERVIHNFESEIKHVSEDSVTCLFPSCIKRHQKRDNFRVKIAYDAYASFRIDDSEIRMVIENLSAGGMFCYCLNKHKPIFSDEQLLEKIDLIMNINYDILTMRIDKVRVNRIEPNLRPKHFGIAFEFVRMKKDTEKKLVHQVYELHRHFLKQRMKITI